MTRANGAGCRRRICPSGSGIREILCGGSLLRLVSSICSGPSPIDDVGRSGTGYVFISSMGSNAPPGGGAAFTGTGSRTMTR